MGWWMLLWKPSYVSLSATTMMLWANFLNLMAQPWCRLGQAKIRSSGPFAAAADHLLVCQTGSLLTAADEGNYSMQQLVITLASSLIWVICNRMKADALRLKFKAGMCCFDFWWHLQPLVVDAALLSHHTSWQLFVKRRLNFLWRWCGLTLMGNVWLCEKVL